MGERREELVFKIHKKISWTNFYSFLNSNNFFFQIIKCFLSFSWKIMPKFFLSLHKFYVKFILIKKNFTKFHKNFQNFSDMSSNKSTKILSNAFQNFLKTHTFFAYFSSLYLKNFTEILSKLKIFINFGNIFQHFS